MSVYSVQPISSRRATASITAIPSALSLRQGIAANFSPPACAKIAGVFDADLLERLQAVGDEAGGDDGEALDAALGQLPHRVGGVGLQPFGPAEARLERHPQPLLAPSRSAVAQQARRLGALAIIGIALVEIGLRDAVKGGEHDLRLEIELRQPLAGRSAPAPRYRPGSSYHGAAIRIAGCQRIAFSASNALSATVAVDAAQYCG